MIVSEKQFISISFQDLIDSLYLECDISENKEIITDYLKCFHYLTNSEKFDFHFDDIPYTGLFKEYADIYYEIQYLLDKIWNQQISPKFQNDDEHVYFRYLLIIFYYSLDLSKSEKNKIKKCFELIK